MLVHRVPWWLVLLAFALLLSAASCGRRRGEEAKPTSAPNTPAAVAAARPAAPSQVPQAGALAAGADRFGVYIWNAGPDVTSRALELAHQIGFRWARLSFSANQIEPAKGTFNWSEQDAIVAKAKDEQVQILALLAYAQQWNTTAPPDELKTSKREHYPPRDYAAWGQFVFETVSHYKGTVHAWEVWNEPDLSGGWGGTPAQYAELLALAYQQIKRADPSATVLLGGLSLGGSQERRDERFLEEILADRDHPAAASFDAANFHFYGPRPDANSKVDFVRGELAKVGVGDRPIWVTEVGYSSLPGLQRISAYPRGPEGQVAYLRDVVPYLLQLGVAKVFWYQLYDRDGGAGTFAAHGLLDADLNPRPAFDAFRALVAGQP